MSRIELVPADIREPAGLVAAIRERRGGTLLNLDRALLHSVPLAGAWNDYLRVIRTGLSIPARLRELAICGVAVLNGADYEFSQHAPEFIRAGGSDDAVRKLRDFETAALDTMTFDALDRMVMALTIRMTRFVDVDDDTWERVRTLLPDAQAQIEIVSVIATYNMVSRFLIACRIEPESDR